MPATNTPLPFEINGVFYKIRPIDMNSLDALDGLIAKDIMSTAVAAATEAKINDLTPVLHAATELAVSASCLSAYGKRLLATPKGIRNLVKTLVVDADDKPVTHDIIKEPGDMGIILAAFYVVTSGGKKKASGEVPAGNQASSTSNDA